MNNLDGLRITVILLCALLAAIAHADAPRQLMWADLAPKLDLDNPFSKLSREQLLAFSDIAMVRERRARGEKLSPIDVSDEQASLRKLEQAGIDVDGLLAKRKEIAERKRAHDQAVNTGLNGQIVRLPGYVLPLEFTGKMVTEFLLVPWVGACIHTPPPPPNQIVHVKADKPVETHGMFLPVWVTGQIATGATKKSLYMVDGAADIDVGYSIRASLVEPYKE
jgi:hypothetical protein